MKVDIREVHALDNLEGLIMGTLEVACHEVPSSGNLGEPFLVAPDLGSPGDAYLEVHHSLDE